MDTQDNISTVPKSIENAYGLIKQLKKEFDKDEGTEEINNIINEISDIMEEISNTDEKENEEAEENVEETEEIVEEKRKLIISEKQEKVILPYTKENIDFFINEGKYETAEDVIENEYTLPLSRFKNEAISRVVEGYKLARKKDGKSVKESLKFAVNLVFERRLHPSIITACKTVDELDIYLACLEDNVTEFFDAFEVIFEYAPLKIKNKDIDF